MGPGLQAPKAYLLLVSTVLCSVRVTSARRPAGTRCAAPSSASATSSTTTRSAVVGRPVARSPSGYREIPLTSPVGTTVPHSTLRARSQSVRAFVARARAHRLARYPARHGIPHGTVSRGMVSHCSANSGQVHDTTRRGGRLRKDRSLFRVSGKSIRIESLSAARAPRSAAVTLE